MLFLQVELIVNPSDEVIPKLNSEYGLERLDFVFMDHWKKCYAPDLQVIRVEEKMNVKFYKKNLLVQRTNLKL